MKKIAIVTHYYNSINYGGNLQAYALCLILNKMGNDAEQLCYSIIPERKGFFGELLKLSRKKEFRQLLYLIKIKLIRVLNYLRFPKEVAEYKRIVEERKKAFYHFNQVLTKHSTIIYTDSTLNKSVSNYDVFITGSDQVWNVEQFRPGYYLTFVPNTALKISYAASLGKEVLNNVQKKYVREALCDYKYISVRESGAKKILTEITDKDITVCADPTLLVAAEHWEDIASDRLEEEKYILCYYMGNNQKARDVCSSYAKQNRLKIVSIPMANNGCRFTNVFGDRIIKSPSPQEFLSLIKYSEYVFTDSYHAVIFSYVFKRQFFVFDRDESKSMNSRIIEITSIFDSKDRYCSGEKCESLEYISTLQPIDFEAVNERVNQLKEKSIMFINNALNDAH